MKLFCEINFLLTSKEACYTQARKLSHDVFYFYVIASLLVFVVCFCCQYGTLLARFGQLVLKNIKLKVRVGNVVCVYFDYR